MNSKPQNTDRLRKLPKNICVYCGRLLGNFHPLKGSLISDWNTNKIVGWSCRDGCDVDESMDDDLMFDG